MLASDNCIIKVESLKPSNPWNKFAGVEVQRSSLPKKKLKYGFTHADLDPSSVDLGDYLAKNFPGEAGVNPFPEAKA